MDWEKEYRMRFGLYRREGSLGMERHGGVIIHVEPTDGSASKNNGTDDTSATNASKDNANKGVSSGLHFMMHLRTDVSLTLIH